jgi:hypothetical protein
MTAVQFRNPEVRLSEALRSTRSAVSGHSVTLRELLRLVGEQGLLVFCAVLAMPFLLPVSLPFMSTALGAPMLLIAFAIITNRVPWLPDRLLDHALPSATVQHVLERATRAAGRFEHLVRPRVLMLTATAGVNSLNGIVLMIVVLLLMAPLPLVPLANTLPGVAIVLLCLGMAERDGVMLMAGYVAGALSAAYVLGIFWLAVNTGSQLDTAWQTVDGLATRWFGG